MASSGEVVTASGLKYVFSTPGNGKRAQDGDFVTIQYVGSFLDGTVFASTREPGREPYSFRLGKDSLIKGTDEAIRLMKVGSRAVFTMPPDLAYGKQGVKGIIPPDATLVFDYEVIEVKGKSAIDIVRDITPKRLKSVAARVRKYVKRI